MGELRRRILAGDTLLGTWLDLASPLSAEICGNAGFDWLVIDLEHGSASEADLLGLIHAVGATPAAAIVRPQSGERLRIGRALDLGADGVVIPQLGGVAEVAEALRYLRYPPIGTRGVAMRTRGAQMGRIAHEDLAATVNEAIVGIVQIESMAALKDVDKIAALDAADVVFVGPADLTHALGVPGRFDDPAYRAALKAVVAAAGRYGKAAGILLYEPTTVAHHLELGFRFVGLGSEGSFVANGAKSILSAAVRI